MQELHKIRAEMSKDWEKMTSQEVIKSINEAGKWLKKQISSRSKKL